eukprot:4516388-Pyramimonas_sp.AAC.3
MRGIGSSHITRDPRLSMSLNSWRGTAQSALRAFHDMVASLHLDGCIREDLQRTTVTYGGALLRSTPQQTYGSGGRMSATQVARGSRSRH